MHIHNFSNQQTILNTFVSEMRDVNIQKDSMRFRRNIERIGEILGYELSKTLSYKQKTITTPLGICEIEKIDNDIVLCSILRAGVPLHNGLLNYFDRAENAFISAYRHHQEKPENFEIIVEYLACPNLENKTLILADPMLATGQSMLATFEALKPFGKPKNIHLVSVIAAQEGINFVEKHFDKD
ncbi:MAG: uracil phosphoribosyltransferase, partial [Xanthomarina sp.]